MTWIVKACKHLVPLLVVFAFLAVAGCEGTVEEFAGKKNLDRMNQMKKDIDKAQEQQQERFEKTDESAGEK